MPAQSGMAFPISKDRKGYWQPRGRKQLILASMQMIMGTRPGERRYLPEFGSRLEELELEPNDEVLEALLKEYTVEAITRWENRVRVLSVQIVLAEHTARITTFWVDAEDPKQSENTFVFTIQRG